MANFVRTTGGLLQLKDKAISNKDYLNIVQLVHGAGMTEALSRPEPTVKKKRPPAAPSLTRHSVNAKQPQDLQSDKPAIFR